MFFILVVVVEVKDTFDWAKYLMEDEDLECGPYPDTPVSTPSVSLLQSQLETQSPLVQVWSELCVVVMSKEPLINK